MKATFILYVSDQEASARFYEQVLMVRPSLDVPGMTEFKLNEQATLGLMPVTGIRRLLGAKLRDPDQAKGVPRAEIYLSVDAPQAFHDRALEHGATELSPLAIRDWGDEAAYSSDLDGHVLAFARTAGLE